MIIAPPNGSGTEIQAGRNWHLFRNLKENENNNLYFLSFHLQQTYYDFTNNYYTWDDHGCLSLHVLLFPGTFVELFVRQRNLIGLHMAPLLVL